MVRGMAIFTLVGLVFLLTVLGERWRIASVAETLLLPGECSTPALGECKDLWGQLAAGSQGCVSRGWFLIEDGFGRG